MIALLLALTMSGGAPNTTARSLSVENIAEQDREKYVKATSFVLNSLSKKKKPVQPKLVGDKIQFDLDDYGIDPKVFDGLKHPYPRMRADWFIVNALVAPTYYKLLGAEDWKAFKKLINYDESKIDELKQRRMGIVGTSSVTLHNRLIMRTEYPDGVVWETRDVNSSVGERDFIRNLLGYKYDSREVIARLPNGLLAYYVLDKNDDRLDSVDVDIAVDHSSPLPDRVVRTARSCVVCHKVAAGNRSPPGASGRYSDLTRLALRRNAANISQYCHFF